MFNKHLKSEIEEYKNIKWSIRTIETTRKKIIVYLEKTYKNGLSDLFDIRLNEKLSNRGIINGVIETINNNQELNKSRCENFTNFLGV
jgi:hypothetical protein